jgi:phosphate transport system protein
MNPCKNKGSFFITFTGGTRYMASHYRFHHDLKTLNKKLLKLSSMTEDRVRRAVAVIKSQDEAEIQSILRSDYEIDEMEVEIEEECLKLLALHQPVAGDLRLIITIIKINNEIERIADTAVNIAMRVETISKCSSMEQIFDFSIMSEKVIMMLKMSLDSLVSRDSQMARHTFIVDDEVDAIRNEAYRAVKKLLVQHPDHAGCLINTYLLARHLERIADRATNIAEEVVHLVEGSIVRSQV